MASRMAAWWRQSLKRRPVVTNTLVYATFYTAAELSQQTFNRMNMVKLLVKSKISFTLYPAYNMVGRVNLVSRHSVPHFLWNSGGMVCWVAELKAALCLDTRAKHSTLWFLLKNPFYTFPQNLQGRRDEWRNSIPYLASTPERKKFIYNILFTRLVIEPTTCRLQSHTCTPVLRLACISVDICKSIN